MIKESREFMKANFEELENFQTDQMKKMKQPPLNKAYEGKERIDLPKVTVENAPKADVFTAIVNRKSRRKFTEENLTLLELAFLLYSTQGLRFVNASRKYSMRTVPSGGSRQPFETYLAINRVEGIKPGIYNYDPLEHQLIYLKTPENMIKIVGDAASEQRFVGDCAVTFIWSCIPYRGEWRYHVAAHKTMLLDAGHVCQNLYIACEAISMGTCAIAAYDQKKFDELLDLDGENEFVVYLAPVGKLEDK